jgi:hypothetical protein
MGYSKPHLRFTPAYWAKPEVAREWLAEAGWVVGNKRARRGSESIPAPQSGFLYDLHDAACVEGIGCSDLIARIIEWAVEKGYDPSLGLAGGGKDFPYPAEG